MSYYIFFINYFNYLAVLGTPESPQNSENFKNKTRISLYTSPRKRDRPLSLARRGFIDRPDA